MKAPRIRRGTDVSFRKAISIDVWDGIYVRRLVGSPSMAYIRLYPKELIVPMSNLKKERKK